MTTINDVKGTVLYSAQTRTTGGRDGAARSSDGRLDIQLSLPGTAGNGTNPEQLFAAGWSACFLGALSRVARHQKLVVPADASIAAEIQLCQGDEGYFLRAQLNVSLPGVDRQIGQALIEEAHKVCPYSKATRGNIDVAIVLA